MTFKHMNILKCDIKTNLKIEKIKFFHVKFWDMISSNKTFIFLLRWLSLRKNCPHTIVWNQCNKQNKKCLGKESTRKPLCDLNSQKKEITAR